MNKIEDIEMIDPLMVEQIKPLNKIGITHIAGGGKAAGGLVPGPTDRRQSLRLSPPPS
jgi:hypothetical protein